MTRIIQAGRVHCKRGIHRTVNTRRLVNNNFRKFLLTRYGKERILHSMKKSTSETVYFWASLALSAVILYLFMWAVISSQ